jgi:hypothetical protein
MYFSVGTRHLRAFLAAPIVFGIRNRRMPPTTEYRLGAPLKLSDKPWKYLIYHPRNGHPPGGLTVIRFYEKNGRVGYPAVADMQRKEREVLTTCLA